MANSLKKFIPLFMGLCLAFGVQADTKTWKKDVTNDSWNTASNWSGGLPTASDDVIIPAGCTTYPTAVTDSKCRYIYVESGARLGGQEKLTYEKAFVDLTLPTNRYVRIVPPLREVYTGDLFTKEQGGEWTNFTESSIASATSGTSANRMFPGATYISLFATNGTNYDAYMGVDVRDATTSWADPFNALSHRFNEGESFDVWVDNEGKDDATFHFPAGDKEYHYFRENGNIDPLTESITRTNSGYKFLFDASSVTGTGYYDRTFAANGTAMFASGNPTMSLMSIKLFMEKNVEAKYVTPFIYRHTNGEKNADGRGSESILYYNAAQKKLFAVNGSAEDDKVPTATDENEVEDSNPLAYINPAEGFRLMSGVTAIYTIEPALLGNFAPSDEPGSVSEYEYYGVNTYNGSSWVTKYGKAAGSNETGDTAVYELAITLTATDDPGVVRIGNFLQRGYVYATIDAVGHTLTIPNGSQVFYGSHGAWRHGANDYIPADRIFYIYGCTDNTPVFSGEYSFNTNWKAPKVTNIGADVVFDYIVDNENRKVSISLQKPFVLYSQQFKDNNDLTYYNTDEAEAYWVYKSIESKKTIDESSGGSAFILPEALGKFSTKVDSKEGSPAGGITKGMINNGITISPLQGVYEYVLVDGLYPGVENYPVVGMITNDGTENASFQLESYTESTGNNKRNKITVTGKRTRYRMTILSGQLVNEVSTSDLSRNFFLYYKGRGQSIVFDWYTEVKKTTQPQKKSWGSWSNNGTATVENLSDRWRQGAQLQVSYLNCNPNGDSFPGFYMSESGNCTLTRIGDLDDGSGSGEGGGGSSETITPGSTSAPHTVTFHKDMFAANQGDFEARLAELTAAPKRRNAKAETTKASMLNIVATSQNDKKANTMLVLSQSANDGFNRFEDAPLFDASDAAFTFASLAGEQLVGVNVSSTWTNIPLFLTGSATLTFNGISSYDGELWLYDALDSVEYLLQEGDTRFLTINEGEKAGRWFIRNKSTLAPDVLTDINNVDIDWEPTAWNPQSGTLVVRTGRNTETMTTLYAMSGQCVERQVVADMAVFRGVPAGTYILMLVSDGTTKQIKTIVK